MLPDVEKLADLERNFDVRLHTMGEKLDVDRHASRNVEYYGTFTILIRYLNSDN